MEEEIYIEESNPRRTKINIVIIILLVSISFLVFILFKARYTLNLNKIEVEVGDKLNKDLSFYIKNEILDEEDYKLYLNDVPVSDGILDTVGKFNYKVKYKNITKKGTFIVNDHTPPIVKVQNLTVGVNEEYEVDWFLTKCDDYSKPCIVTYKNEDDEFLQQKAGKYNFDILIEDNYGNKVTEKVSLTVKKGYSLENTRKKDQTVTRLSEDYKDWDKKRFISFSVGKIEDEISLGEEYNYLYELTSGDLLLYLPFQYVANQIVNHELIYVYNKYDYVIAILIRVELDNGKYLYLEK